MAVTLGSLQTEGGGDGTRQSVTQAGTNSQTVSASRRCREWARSGRQLPSSSLEGRSEGRAAGLASGVGPAAPCVPVAERTLGTWQCPFEMV